ncbi:ATP-binding protein [Deinococcus cellulosilyticus]|uniref:histidine kinase n=1 Tax=Deinococcus cellulosilyticus (strain DSM 18568 / NBRC 106333 / KACC 11606 / 5516J-15) TaxID=1223518 RepID=A0A511N6L6_DEIC1|nr:sensor histidine kinase [Deinococcus cellulosilyticus]GEM48485.1 sensor histidine kinase [Deinococcus cellulosilyticus NBRC 106333 = KACC 11606]
MQSATPQTRDYIPTLNSGRMPGIRWRFFRLLFVLFSLGFLMLGGAEVQLLYRQALDDYGEKALAISRMVATLPQVKEHLTRKDAVQVINPLVNALQKQVGADFIVVGNRQGIRVAHPLPDRIGQPMVGGDNDAPFAGKEIINTATGSLGDSIRGKVPVYSSAGTVIGVVSTGYLLPNLRSLALQVALSLLPWFGLSLLMGLLGSLWVGGRIKAAMHHLEPEQIAALVDQHRTVLDAIEDAVLVVQGGVDVVLMNPKAAGYFADAVQLPFSLAQVWPEVLELLQGERVQNAPVNLVGVPVLVTVYPMNGQQVVTFRDQRAIMQVAEELTSVRRYTNLLRAQTHEFQNLLHILAGLIRLKDYDEALQLIQQQNTEHTEIQDALGDIQFPKLKALLLGKYAYAREKNVNFVLEPGSVLTPGWEQTHSDEILLITGNLIENALEAVVGQEHAEVRVFIGEDPEGLQIEVTDNGPGVPSELADSIFQRGFSTKGEHRGLGLSLVQQYLTARGGSLRHHRKEGRTHFLVGFPRVQRSDHAV